MSKKKSLLKNFNKLLLSVNARIESFFNSINVFLISKKKTKKSPLNIDNKILLIIGTTVTLVFIYFLIPTSYNKDLVKSKLTKQILKEYNLEVNLEGELKYGLFPKPHYFIKGTNIIYNEKNLAKIDLLKIYISSGNFFSFENIKIKDLIFNKTEFDINYNNFNFFEKTLNSIKSKYNILFKNSKLFYKDQNENVIFLTKISNLNFSYTDDFFQKLNAKLNIFNVPFKINILNDLKKRNATIDVESHKLRINIHNNFDYSEVNIKGLLDFKAINKKKTINYIINKDSLNFKNSKNNFEGKIDFKPFYITSDLKLHQIDVIKIFKNDSILLNLFNAEILNNQSINAVASIYFEKIKNINYLNNIALKVYFEQGNIILKNSTLNWKNSIQINIDDVQLISEDNKIMFAGGLTFDFKDINDFYRQYQIKKNYRKKIKKIKLDFLLDVNEKQIELDNVRIDGSSNKIANNFMRNFNSQKRNIFNKIIFKNSIKEFFKDIYSG